MKALLFFGSFKAFPVLTVLAVWGVVVSTTYLLRAVKAVFLGPLKERNACVCDLSLSDRLPYAILAVALLWIGFVPRSVTEVPSRQPPYNPQNIMAGTHSPHRQEGS